MLSFGVHVLTHRLAGHPSVRGIDSGEENNLLLQTPTHLPELKERVIPDIEEERKTFTDGGEIRIETDITEKSALAASHLNESRAI
jgi:hypothetical protein